MYKKCMYVCMFVCLSVCPSDGLSVLTSCQEAKQLGKLLSGVNTLDLGDGLDSFQVYCDMSTDGGGCTVF